MLAAYVWQCIVNNYTNTCAQVVNKNDDTGQLVNNLMDTQIQYLHCVQI